MKQHSETSKIQVDAQLNGIWRLLAPYIHYRKDAAGNVGVNNSLVSHEGVSKSWLRKKLCSTFTHPLTQLFQSAN